MVISSGCKRRGFPSDSVLDNDTSRISAESHLIPGQRLRANTNTEDKKKTQHKGRSEGKKIFSEARGSAALQIISR